MSQIRACPGLIFVCSVPWLNGNLALVEKYSGPLRFRLRQVLLYLLAAEIFQCLFWHRYSICSLLSKPVSQVMWLFFKYLINSYSLIISVLSHICVNSCNCALLCVTLSLLKCALFLLSPLHNLLYRFVNFSDGLLPSSVEVWCLFCVLTIYCHCFKKTVWGVTVNTCSTDRVTVTGM